PDNHEVDSAATSGAARNLLAGGLGALILIFRIQRRVFLRRRRSYMAVNPYAADLDEPPHPRAGTQLDDALQGVYVDGLKVLEASVHVQMNTGQIEYVVDTIDRRCKGCLVADITDPIFDVAVERPGGGMYIDGAHSPAAARQVPD